MFLDSVSRRITHVHELYLLTRASSVLRQKLSQRYLRHEQRRGVNELVRKNLVIQRKNELRDDAFPIAETTESRRDDRMNNMPDSRTQVREQRELSPIVKSEKLVPTPINAAANPSSVSRDDILSRLSPRLRAMVEGGVLTDVQFQFLMRQENLEPSTWKMLASLIQSELDQPRRRLAGKNRQRKRNLLANAAVVRDNMTNKDDSRIQVQITIAQKWGDYLRDKLKRISGVHMSGVAARTKKEQIRAVIFEADEKLRMLQSKALAESWQHNKKDSSDSLKTTLGDLDTLITPKSAQLPSRLYHQLSRDLLDSLNEVAFVFGQREAPNLMKKNRWVSPESIDLPVFLFSFSLHPGLFHLHKAHEKVFARLREFRNQYAHGISTHFDELILTLDDVDSVARLLRAPNLAAKVNDYRSLLVAFRESQTGYSNRAYSIAKETVKKLQTTLEAELQKPNTKSTGSQGVDQGALNRLVISQAEQIKELWEDAECGLAMYAARELSQSVGEAQIRRTMAIMGPDSSNLLSKMHQEQSQSSGSGVSDADAKKYLEILERKLSESSSTTKIGENLTRLPHADDQNDIHPDEGQMAISYPSELPDHLPGEESRAQDIMLAEARKRKKRLGKIAAMVRKGQSFGI